jgi:hypothetical protein
MSKFPTGNISVAISADKNREVRKCILSVETEE